MKQTNKPAMSMIIMAIILGLTVVGSGSFAYVQQKALQQSQTDNNTLMTKLTLADKKAKAAENNVATTKSSAITAIEAMREQSAQLRAQLSYYESRDGVLAGTTPVSTTITSASDFTTTRQLVMEATKPIVMYICSDSLRAACVLQNSSINSVAKKLAGQVEFRYFDPLAKSSDPVLLGFFQQLGINTVPSLIVFVPGKSDPLIISGYLSEGELITVITPVQNTAVSSTKPLTDTVK